jgi:hypothetical protein
MGALDAASIPATCHQSGHQKTATDHGKNGRAIDAADIERIAQAA